MALSTLRSVTKIRKLMMPSSYLIRFSSTAKQTSISYWHTPEATPLSGLTIGSMLDKAVDEVGDDIVYIVSYQGIQKTFSQFRKEVDMLATGLLSIGLKPGDMVGLWGLNSYEWIQTLYATAKIGTILVSINPAYQASELKYCLNKAGCSALVLPTKCKVKDSLRILCEIAPNIPQSKPGFLQNDGVPDLRSIIAVGDENEQGTISFNGLFNAGGSDAFKTMEEIQNKLQCDDTINIHFTSGTTGNPKAVMLTHHNLMNNACFSGRRMGFHKMKHTICCPLPIFHCFGCSIGVYAAVVHRISCVLPSVFFNAEETLKAITKERCTVMLGTPTMYIDMMQILKDSKAHDVSTLKKIVFGGATCLPEVSKKIRETYETDDIINGYGSTENSPAVLAIDIDDPMEKKTSCSGRPMGHIEVKVIDNEGLIVPPNTRGELCTRGYMVLKGYFKDKERTDEVIDESGWYHTGDIATMDENGFVEIVGRLKDMIIRGGENIYSAEIENFLHGHPAILEAHVVGVPDKRRGEEVCAWIKVKEGASLTEQEFKDYCKGKISTYKIPLYIMFVEEFPKTAVGKVQKFKMQEVSIKKLNLS